MQGIFVQWIYYNNSSFNLKNTITFLNAENGRSTSTILKTFINNIWK